MTKELSFVATDNQGHITSLWDVEETGHYGTDCARGRECFQELMDTCEHDPSHMTTFGVLREIVEKGHFGPIETGFMNALAEHTIRSARTTL